MLQFFGVDKLRFLLEVPVLKSQRNSRMNRQKSGRVYNSRPEKCDEPIQHK